MTRAGASLPAALVAALALATTPSRAEAMRCAGKLILQGDHAAEVLHYCGEPVAVRSWVAQRGVVGFGSVFLPGFGFVEEVLIEEWTYNFGPRRLMRQVRLEDGIVREIESLGYGYPER